VRPCRLRITAQTAMEMTALATAAAPIPMPALAPMESLLKFEPASLATALAVAVDEVEAVVDEAIPVGFVPVELSVVATKIPPKPSVVVEAAVGLADEVVVDWGALLDAALD